MSRELTHEEIKQRQIEILKYFKSVCEEIGARYSLAYGTLLGAVRHGGYIPWDDDIDVCMPREDYDRLISELKNRKGRFFLLDLDTNKTYYQNFAKIVDTETVFVRHDKSIKEIENYGINIDIFPFDNCPADDRQFKNMLIRLGILKRFRFYIIKKGIPKGSNKIKTALFCLIKCFAIIFGYRFWLVKYEKQMKKYNSQSTGLMCPWSTIMSSKEIVSVSQFENMGKITFEDEEYSCFADVDKYLTDRYGDYMQPPPEKERVTPHGYKAYLKGEN